MPKPDQQTVRTHRLQLEQAIAEASTRHSKLPPDSYILITIAILRLHGFSVGQATHERTFIPKAHRGRYGIGPSVIIVAQNDLELRRKLWYAQDTPDTNIHHTQLDMARLYESEALAALLAEFYAARQRRMQISAHIRLILSNDIKLVSQGSEYMALPSAEPHRQAWLEQARAEMQAFTEFLVEKYMQSGGRNSRA